MKNIIQINALRKDIREVRELARLAHESAGTHLLMGSDDEGWTEVAKQYEEQAQRLESVLKSMYRRMRI